MRPILMLIAAAGFGVACATATPEQPSATSSPDEDGHHLTAVISQRLSAQPAAPDIGSPPDEPPDRTSAPSGASQPADTPDAAAAQAIIQLHEDEGLLVLAIDTVAEPADGSRATIRTTVLYGTGRSHPQETSYLLEVESIVDTWTVVSIEAAP